MNIIRTYLILWSFMVSVQAVDYHVSTTGSDTAIGSEAAPWRTLAHAAANAMAGDTVLVHGGTWNEPLRPTNSGTATSPIVFRAQDGASPIIDGTGLSVSGREGLVELRDRSHIRIEGFTIRNLSTNLANQTPVGLLIEGQGQGIEIVDNVIEDIAATVAVNPEETHRNAFGIAVYGTGAEPLSDLTFRGNTLRNLTLGSSEAFAINGNVTNFVVLNNHIHDCDNIGFDAIGFEGTSSAGIDQARVGWFVGNTAERCSSTANPSYLEPTAAGIYVDGGQDITIARNRLDACDYGIELGSEHAGQSTQNIIARSNLITGCSLAGMAVGGYSEVDTGDGGGSADQCKILNNTFVNNDADSADEFGQLYIQYRVNDFTVANNIFANRVGDAGDYKPLIVQWNATGSNQAFTNNLFFAPDKPIWVINNDWIESFAEYQTASSSTNDQFADPLLDSAYTLQVGSPAIDAGLSAQVVTGERDYPGRTRFEGVAPDCGCIETASLAVSAPEPSLLFQDTQWHVQWTKPEDGFCTLEFSDNMTGWQTVPGQDSLSVDGDFVQLNEVLEGLERRFYRLTLH